jgi:hypothetical protein
MAAIGESKERAGRRLLEGFPIRSESGAMRSRMRIIPSAEKTDRNSRRKVKDFRRWKFPEKNIEFS